jgi:hypothetical protein
MYFILVAGICPASNASYRRVRTHAAALAATDRTKTSNGGVREGQGAKGRRGLPTTGRPPPWPHSRAPPTLLTERASATASSGRCAEHGHAASPWAALRCPGRAKRPADDRQPTHIPAVQAQPSQPGDPCMSEEPRVGGRRTSLWPRGADLWSGCLGKARILRSRSPAEDSARSGSLSTPLV